MIGTSEFRALGTTCRVLVAERGVAGSGPTDQAAVEALARRRLDDLDRAASRFRLDSELMLFRADGLPHQVSELLGDVVVAAVRVAELTDGLVDPTVGNALVAAGYDEDLAVIQRRTGGRRARTHAVAGWRNIRYDAATRLLALPPGVLLDVGASGKAFLADRLAAEIAATHSGGVLVDLGGDIAVAGAIPDGGWSIGVEDAGGRVDQVVRSTGQAFATSSTQLRTWFTDGERRHHILDPRTGQVAEPVWRMVTVAAASALEANAGATAAVVLGADGPGWLSRCGLPARLVSRHGQVAITPGWPSEAAA